MLILSLLTRDPWPTDVPHLFDELKKGTPHAWAFVKTLQRYAIHDRPVHQDLPPEGVPEIQWQPGLRVEASWLRTIERHRRRSLLREGEARIKQDALDELTGSGDRPEEFREEWAPGNVEYFSKDGAITICDLSTAERRWLDWHARRQGPLRMGRSEEFIIAAIDGGLDRLRAKLEANPEAATSKSDGETTALHHAAEYGHADVVRLLLSAGARRNALDYRGKLPLDLALENGHAAVVSELSPRQGVVDHEGLWERDRTGLTAAP